MYENEMIFAHVDMEIFHMLRALMCSMLSITGYNTDKGVYTSII